MSVIRTMTLRQMRAERTRTGLTLLEITIASGLLSAVLMGGISLAGTIYPEVHDMAAWKDVIDRSPLALLVLMATAVMAVPLLLATAFLIRSAFTVSLSQRVRALGQLASVGATRRQLQASVYWEALILGAAAVPAGIACAALGLWITFTALNRVDAVARLLGDLDALFVAETGQSIPNTLHLSVSPLGLLLCALWSALMLFLAAQRPARTAFRVEPIETFSPTRRALSTYRAVPWHMERSAEPQLARRSRAQDRTRHWTLCASMAVSLALIVTASGFSGGLREAYRLGKQPYDSRWYVWGVGGTYPQEVLAQAVQLFPGIPSLRTEMDTSYIIDEESGKSACSILFILEDTDFEAWYGALLTPLDDQVPVVLSQGDSVFWEGSTWDTLQSRLQPVYRIIAQCPEGVCSTPLPLNAGAYTRDKISVNDGYIATVTNRSAFAHAFRLQDKPTLQDRSFAVYYATEDGARMAQPLEELAASYAASGQDTFRALWQDYSTTSQWAAHRKAITLIVNVFSWGFTVLVFLGVSVSLVGTMSADFALRRREFALLRSAGMEQRQMDRFFSPPMPVLLRGPPLRRLAGRGAVCLVFPLPVAPHRQHVQPPCRARRGGAADGCLPAGAIRRAQKYGPALRSRGPARGNMREVFL